MRRLWILLALAGVALGAALAIVGVPYGRVNPRAFAELYHGTTNADGTIHVALDCDTFTAGTQTHCAFFASGFSLGVTVGNETGAPVSIAAFNFRVTNSRQDLFDPATVADTNLDSNPDFNQSVAGPGWSCTPPPPNRDEDPSPSTSVSFLSCVTGFVPGAIVVPDGSEHVRLASVLYNGAGPIGPFQTAVFTLSDVNLADDTMTEILSCNPVNSVAGPCFDATADWGLPPPPTFPPTFTATATPTATPTPPPDADSDGVPDSSDNCPFSPNPLQENLDGNLISAQGLHVDDATRAYSDEYGDLCDPDLDNDRRSNDYESGWWDSCGPTVDYLPDTDGDRVLDQAECDLGTDPRVPGSKPSPASCAAHLGVMATTDTDGDGLKDYLEFCGYGTFWNTVNTDGDVSSDGCEAISLNGDTKVNSGDQLLLVLEYLRVPPPARLANYDLNKDGPINSGDQLLMLQFFGTCP